MKVEDHLKIERILDEADIASLLEYFDSEDVEEYHQNYNLFDVIYQRVPSKHPVLSKLIKYAGMPLKTSYMLKYEEGSFARAHQDDDSDLTIVTILETKDLVGGESLCFLPYAKRPRVKLARRNKRETKKPPYGDNIIPYIIDCEDGESLVYNRSLKHSVSLVKSGYRKVLITWFNKRGNQ